MSEVDLDALKPWIGRSETSQDILTPGLIDRSRATFRPHLSDRDAVPLGLHWCLTLDTMPTTALSVDGHPKRGDFLPPVPLPSRMWAGDEITHIAPLSGGETVTRRSTIAEITAKIGRKWGVGVRGRRTRIRKRRPGLHERTADDRLSRHQPVCTGRTRAGHARARHAAMADHARPHAAVSLFRADVQCPPHTMTMCMRSGPRAIPGSSCTDPCRRRCC